MPNIVRTSTASHIKFEALANENAEQPATQPQSSNADVHGLSTWHNAKITGSSIQVGIIDRGFQGFASNVQPRLTATPTALCFRATNRTISKDPADCEHTSAHGQTVAKTLIDTAPDVQLYISNPINHEELINAVHWMAARFSDDPGGDSYISPSNYEPPYVATDNNYFNIKIINHSISYPWDGPGDGTSWLILGAAPSPLETVDTATANGAIWAT